MAAKGNRIDNRLKADPELASAFALYVQCRSLQLVTVDIPKGQGRDQKTLKLTLPFPTGITTLPEAGGLLDQPYRLWEFFEIFLNAERKAVFDKMK